MRRQPKARHNEPRRSQRRSRKAGEAPKLKERTVTRVFSGEVKRQDIQFTKALGRNSGLESRLVPDDQLLQQYHLLVDKRLNGMLHPQEARELHRIEAELQLFEDAESAKIELGIEQRHQMLMQQLSELTAELRRFNSGEQSRREIP